MYLYKIVNTLIVIEEIDAEASKDGWVSSEIRKHACEDAYVNNEWVKLQIEDPVKPHVITLENLKVIKTNEIDEACKKVIISGFVSSALGEPYTYGSDIVDQINFQQSYALSKIQGSEVFKTKNKDGIVEYKLHTAEQFDIAYIDGANMKRDTLLKCLSLKTDIVNALTIEDVNVISW